MKKTPSKHPFVEKAVMIRMEFGSETFFERLRQGVSAGDPDVYLELDQAVERSVRATVANKIPLSEREDVMQEIKLTVYRKLVSFLKRSAEYSPAQRNAWLRAVAKSRINDYYRKNYLRLSPEEEEEWRSVFHISEEEQWRPKFPPLDEEDVVNIADPSTPEENLLSKLRNQEVQNRCDQLIAYVCGLRLPPERIVAFFYNVILVPLSANDGRKKGDPTQIADMLAGRPLEELVRQMKRDLSHLFGRRFPDWVFSPLEEKLSGAQGQVFHMNKREISVVSSRTRVSLCKNREKILGGICDE